MLNYSLKCFLFSLLLFFVLHLQLLKYIHIFCSLLSAVYNFKYKAKIEDMPWTSPQYHIFSIGQSRCLFHTELVWIDAYQFSVKKKKKQLSDLSMNLSFQEKETFYRHFETISEFHIALPSLQIKPLSATGAGE